MLILNHYQPVEGCQHPPIGNQYKRLHLWSVSHIPIQDRHYLKNTVAIALLYLTIILQFHYIPFNFLKLFSILKVLCEEGSMKKTPICLFSWSVNHWNINYIDGLRDGAKDPRYLRLTSALPLTYAFSSIIGMLTCGGMHYDPISW